MRLAAATSIVTALVAGIAAADIVPKTLPANPQHNHTVRNETLGGGTLGSPAVAPPPAYQYGDGFVCVKNWDFGAKGTIKNIADMNANFMYHDQFGTIRNPNYGAVIVAPDQADALPGQPIEGNATGGRPVRAFLADGLKTFIVPLDGATTLSPTEHNAGSGSFQAKWTLPTGGVLLGHDILWETRVRFVPPPYFWMSIWCCGNKWDHGAEMDLIEDFGYDNGRGMTNYRGDYFHSNSAGGSDASPYGDWGATMASYGITDFDASQWHTWAWLYRKDDTYEAFVDGRLCQSGTMHWTLACKPDGEQINMSFIFDGSWGSPTVKNDDFPLAASALANTYYEWGYSRVYLR